MPKQELCELGITSLSKSQVSVMAKELDTAVGGHPAAAWGDAPGVANGSVVADVSALGR